MSAAKEVGERSPIVIYDIETFKSIFCYVETTDGVNFKVIVNLDEMRHHIEHLKQQNATMVGFNNMGFDWPVLDYIRRGGDDPYTEGQRLISTPWESRFNNVIWDPYVTQRDLFKLMHYDNLAKSTSLKKLEFAMRMESIEDLPYSPHVRLGYDQVIEVIDYCKHDVLATYDFMVNVQNEINLRTDLTAAYDIDMTNMNDSKMGSVIFEKKLKDSGLRWSHTSPRDSIALSECIPEWIRFDSPEFQRVHDTLRSKVIRETKGVFDNIIANVGGAEYKFGTGGLHSAIAGTYESDDDYLVLDQDVVSYYPSIAVSQRYYPEHMSEQYCDITADLIARRIEVGKKTTEGAAIKLMINSTYGNTNNKYSEFYDPKYTMSVTLTGQLGLAMLCDQLIKCCTVISSNTDGITLRIQRKHLDHMRQVVKWWEGVTGLQMEEVHYKTLWMRDCNNYIAEYESGGYKHKGAYAFERQYHQDRSALIVPKAASHAIITGGSIAEYIEAHSDPFDFMIFGKVPRNSHMEYGGEVIGNNIRYYVSTDGDILEKVMPPTGELGHYKRSPKCPPWKYAAHDNTVWDAEIHTNNKGTHDIRRSEMQAGWTVRIANTINPDGYNDINYDYYIREAEKLVKGIPT